MKPRFIVLPLWMLAGAAFAQDAAMPPEPPAAAVAETPAAAVAAPVAKPQRRQGADMRHCLDLKDDKAIIRCAEPGRKP
jgi:hypothetical protein